jgi:hypothetical protein
MTPQPYYMPNSTDFVGLFQMACPDCGREVRVQGNVRRLWIVDHEAERGRLCPSSDRDVMRESQRPRE